MFAHPTIGTTRLFFVSFRSTRWL